MKSVSKIIEMGKPLVRETMAKKMSSLQRHLCALFVLMSVKQNKTAQTLSSSHTNAYPSEVLTYMSNQFTN